MSELKKLNNINFLDDIKNIIEEAKTRAAIAVNAEITMVYWKIGHRLKTEVLNNKRAGYGEEIVKKLSHELTLHYGSGWSEKQLRHCLYFVEIFPDEEIVSTMRRQLSWSHIKEIIYIKDDLKREFYIEMCKLERWTVRIFRERIQSQLYERTAISKKPIENIKRELKKLREEKRLSPDLVFRDPYFLDFLGLKDTYSERDLETAIIVELQRFIIEMGSDFAFLARQKRIIIDNVNYKVDLLFYHRRLKCLVAIDLKLGEFEAGYKSQMELYLSWLEKYENAEGENSPIGLILCSGKNEEHIDLLRLDKSNIRVADYFTMLPPRELLLEKLSYAIAIAKQKLDSSNENFKEVGL